MPPVAAPVSGCTLQGSVYDPWKPDTGGKQPRPAEAGAGQSTSQPTSQWTDQSTSKSTGQWTSRPGRIQYDQRNGYCGEVTLQMLMLEHGVWIPQEAARAAGGGELLPGLNYDRAMNALGIRYEAFRGRGYAEFMAWAKGQLGRGRGVVTVAYFRGGRDSEYDHIMPIVAYKSCPGAEDVVYVHSNYSVRPQARRVADYSCTRYDKKDGILNAGCVPKDTRWGYAIVGPRYAGLGHRVHLVVEGDREPGLGRSVELRARVLVTGLQPGMGYALHRLAAPPRDATDRLVPVWSRPFVATATEQVHNLIRFKSSEPAYFVCVQEQAGQTGGGPRRAPRGRV